MSDLNDLSPPAAAVQRATEGGLGVLQVGRPWVQYEGWVLKESGALTSGWHLRYFVVSGDRLEYFREEKFKLDLKSGETAGGLLAGLGLEIDATNVVCLATGPSLTPPAPSKERQPQLHEGDVIIGVNGEPCVGVPARSALASAPTSGPLTLSLLRPKGRIALHGASVVPAGPRKGGGHVLTVSVSDSTSRRSKYNLVCADERQCFGWVASIKEAIAASAMEDIKTALSQALSLSDMSRKQNPSPSSFTGGAASAAVQPLQHFTAPNGAARPPRPASAPPQKGLSPRRSASYESNLASLDEHSHHYWSIHEQKAEATWSGTPQASSTATGRSRTSSGSSDRQFEV